MEIFLIRALQLIMALSLLVLIHEFGHFLFARIFKVRVEKFYLFFDWKFSLFKWKPKNSDTEYGMGWIPLGGYCKIAGMIDESMDTEQMKQPAQPWEYRSKPAWQRLLIIVGGVMFNLILAVLIYSMVLFTWGEHYVDLHKMDNGSLHIGAAVSYREPKVTSTDGYNAIRYSTRNSTSINRKKFLDTDAIKGLDHELLWTVELAGHYESLRYEAAYISRQAFVDLAKNEKGADLRAASGWYVQAGYMLFGGKQNYDAGGAKYTRCTRGKDWGDVELAARIDQINLNLNKYYMGGSALQYALGINYYPIENVKFMINYQFADNDVFANGKGEQDGTDKTNKNPYSTGFNADGSISKYPFAIRDGVDGAKGKGVDFHMISCRFQVAF